VVTELGRPNRVRGARDLALDVPHDSAEDEVILAEDRRRVLAAPGTVKSNAARGLAALARKLGETS